jgi:hypothetical protein
MFTADLSQWERVAVVHRPSDNDEEVVLFKRKTPKALPLLPQGN